MAGSCQFYQYMNPQDYYTLQGEPAPLLLTAIHDGHTVRRELLPLFNLSDKERLYEEDPHTAEWAQLRSPHLIGHHSRFEVDLNRPPDKAVYLQPEDAWGLQVWQKQPTREMIERSMQAYDHFYEQVEVFLRRTVKEHGSFVVYDIHSYNHRREENDRRPADPEQNPIVNIGTGNVNRELWEPVIHTFIHTMRQTRYQGRPLDVRENVKFRGGHFNHWIHEQFPDVSCVLSIEFKKVFMDEHTNELDREALQVLQRALSSTFEPVLERRREVMNRTTAEKPPRNATT